MNRTRSLGSSLCAALLLAACLSQSDPASLPASAEEPLHASHAVSEPAPAPDRAPVFRARPGWLVETPANSMRVAEYELPATHGDAAPAAVVVNYFGVNGAGTFDQNLERWCEQFEQPDGRPSREVARIEHRVLADWKLSVFELDGRYVAQLSPGSDERHDEPDWAMVNAVIETGAGRYYAKLVGPRATVESWRESFERFLEDCARP